MGRFTICQGQIMLIASAALAFGLPISAFGQEVVEDRDERVRSARSGDIVVTGRSLDTDEALSLPVGVLAGDELAHRRQGGLGETLSGLPGVHLDSFGGGASRPVIRGQTLPRIEMLTDGANLFDVSSISPDHAITTDPLLLDAIEPARTGGDPLWRQRHQWRDQPDRQQGAEVAANGLPGADLC